MDIILERVNIDGLYVPILDCFLLSPLGKNINIEICEDSKMISIIFSGGRSLITLDTIGYHRIPQDTSNPSGASLVSQIIA
jgi:hypothetical protein